MTGGKPHVVFSVNLCTDVVSVQGFTGIGLIFLNFLY